MDEREFQNECKKLAEYVKQFCSKAKGIEFIGYTPIYNSCLITVTGEKSVEKLNQCLSSYTHTKPVVMDKVVDTYIKIW